jgi:N,N'-diacetyllegionaminate synthase
MSENPFLAPFGKPVIIAEIGAKYAEMSVLKQMVAKAKECGADVVKFQTYRAETISTPGSWFTFEDGSRMPQFDFFKKYELSREDHEELIGYCQETGIAWLSTPSHVEDVELLESFSPIAYKTGSDDLTNTPFLKEIARRGKPMVISTGMCTLSEVESAVEAIYSTGNRDIVLLHCVVSYPSRPEDANLRVIETFRRAFGLPVGLSDHTTDEFTSVLATAMDACVIEKHFTLDYAMKLADWQASLDPAGFKRLVDRVRQVKPALGDGVKRILPTEEKWRAACRKSLFTTRAIAQGEVIGADDIVIRRPSEGIHPHLLDLVVGRTARQDIPANALLHWDMI